MKYITVKFEDGLEHKYTFEDLKSDLLSGKVSPDCLARQEDEVEYKTVTQVLYPNGVASNSSTGRKPWGIIVMAVIALASLFLYFHFWHGKIDFLEVTKVTDKDEINSNFSRICYVDSFFGPSGANATSLVPGHYSIRGHIDLKQVRKRAVFGTTQCKFRFMIAGKNVTFAGGLNSAYDVGLLKKNIITLPKDISADTYSYKITFDILAVEPYLGDDMIQTIKLSGTGQIDAFTCPSISKQPQFHCSSDGVLVVDFRLMCDPTIGYAGAPQRTVDQEITLLAPLGE